MAINHSIVIIYISPNTLNSMSPITYENLHNKKVQPKTFLITEGDVADEMFVILKGSVRAFYQSEGKETTLQFFLEGDTVTSLASFLNGSRSNIFIQTLEECEFGVIKKNDLFKLMERDPAIKEWFYQTAIEKLLTHTGRFAFPIKKQTSYQVPTTSD